MFEKTEEIFKAKAQIVEGSLTIWNARLDALIKAGDIKGAIAHSGSPVEDVANNCGCNVQCGTIPLSPEEVVGGLATRVRK